MSENSKRPNILFIMTDDHASQAMSCYGIRTHDYKLIYWYNDDLGEKGARPGGEPPEWELFDLKKDPNELHNVYHDPQYTEIIRKLTAKLDAQMDEIGDIPMHRR